MTQEKLVQEAVELLQKAPEGSTVRLDNDSWEILKPGWDQADWQTDPHADMPDYKEEERHWAAHEIDGKCCHEPIAVTLVPALLQMLKLRVDYM